MFFFEMCYLKCYFLTKNSVCKIEQIAEIARHHGVSVTFTVTMVFFRTHLTFFNFIFTIFNLYLCALSMISFSIYI